ncbi:MAG: 30S ribosomal protein S3 [Candidatus Gottesmanbacteria bacterium]
MGQKINPNGFRLGILNTWNSRWFADDKRYKDFLLEDVKIRRALTAKLKPAGISKIEIERSINKIDIILHVSRPGMVIGRGGSGLDEVKKFVESIISPLKNKTESKLKLEIKVEPIKQPNLDANLVAIMIADQLAKRLPQRRVVGAAIDKVMGAGAKGVKVILSGRIGGADISRRETYKNGTIPLSTLRENIDFASYPSLTRSGYVGVKVWICKL